MIKVLHIVSGDLWAGAEVMALNLFKNLVKYKDLDLYVVQLNQERLSDEVEGEGITNYIIDETKFNFFEISKRIRQYVQKVKPQILHSHRYKENVLGCIARNKNNRAKLVATQHGMPEIYGGNVSIEHKVVSKFNFIIMKHAFDRVVCVSRDIKEKFVENYGFNPSKCAVIQNGLQIPAIEEKANIHGQIKVGTAGRLFPVKDFPLFVEIANSVVKQDKNVVFLLAGEGPEIEKLQKMVESFKISHNFKFLGHLDDMESFYSGLDLYLNTSRHEGIPMSVLEAMSHGVPVIAPNTGGLREIIEDQKDGFLITERNKENFAAACLKIIRDKDLHLAVSGAGREKIKRSFSAEKMAEGYYSLYRELVTNERYIK